MHDSPSSSSFAARMLETAKLAGNASRLAAACGISRRAVGDYLSGKAEPTRPRLVAMAKAGGVSVEWLATGEGPMRSQFAPSLSTSPINMEILKDAVIAVDEYISEQNLVIHPRIKASLISYFVTLGGTKDSDVILVAEQNISALLALCESQG